MLMRICKRWNQGFFFQIDHLNIAILLRQFVSYINDLSLVFYKILKNIILSINCNNLSFKTLHSVLASG